MEMRELLTILSETINVSGLRRNITLILGFISKDSCIALAWGVRQRRVENREIYQGIRGQEEVGNDGSDDVQLS